MKLRDGTAPQENGRGQFCPPALWYMGGQLSAFSLKVFLDLACEAELARAVASPALVAEWARLGTVRLCEEGSSGAGAGVALGGHQRHTARGSGGAASSVALVSSVPGNNGKQNDSGGTSAAAPATQGRSSDESTTCSILRELVDLPPTHDKGNDKDLLAIKSSFNFKDGEDLVGQHEPGWDERNFIMPESAAKAVKKKHMTDNMQWGIERSMLQAFLDLRAAAFLFLVNLSVKMGLKRISENFPPEKGTGGETNLIREIAECLVETRAAVVGELVMADQRVDPAALFIVDLLFAEEYVPKEIARKFGLSAVGSFIRFFIRPTNNFGTPKNSF